MGHRRASLVSFFLPSGITADNGTDSHITFYGSRNAFSLKVVGPLGGGKNYTGVYINSYGKASVLSNPAGQIVSYSFHCLTRAAQRDHRICEHHHYDQQLGCDGRLHSDPEGELRAPALKTVGRQSPLSNCSGRRRCADSPPKEHSGLPGLGTAWAQAPPLSRPP
jgi:hypothetical protein